jgi:hypothetical protein
MGMYVHMRAAACRVRIMTQRGCWQADDDTVPHCYKQFKESQRETLS